MIDRGTQADPATRRRAARFERGLLVGVLLVAAALRFLWLPQIPPGIEHDEVAEGLIAEGILQGHHALFFQEAYGQEPVFLYLVAGALAAFGRNVLALRFVSAAVGLLTVAAGARLARRLFGSRVALITAAGLAVMLWPVFWSRVGLRGMTLPLTMCLGAEALWRVLDDGPDARRHAALSGLWWGLSAYTYLASRGVPILFAAFVLFLALFGRERLRQQWRELLLVGATAVVIALPLMFYLVGNKGAQLRVYEVDAPLAALRQGDPRLVLQNVPRVLGMFSVQGDLTERNNVPGRPVFPEPIGALLFYLGLVVALARLRDVRYGFLLIWLGVMVSPTLVTTDAPNFVRALGALPAVMMLPGLGVVWLRDRLLRFPPWVSGVLTGVVMIAFVVNVALTVRDYFVDWVQIPETQFVWQTDFAAIAAWLDANPGVVDVTVAGLSNETMDAPGLDLLLRREDVRVRWMDTGSPLSAGGALVVPQAGGRVLAPSVVPVKDDLIAQLAAWGAATVMHARFTEFIVPALPAWAGAPVPFEGNVSLLGVGLPARVVVPGEVVALFSTWQVEPGAHPPLKVFIHLVDGEGVLRAQHDGLDSPARFWRPGDRIVQVHPLALPADLTPGEYALRLGLYDRETLTPYRLVDGRDYLEVGVIQVGR